MTSLNQTQMFKNLKILFDGTLSLTNLIKKVITISQQTCGFIHRNSCDYIIAKILKILYFSLMKLKLEYGWLIWFLAFDIYISQLENVQQKFLKLIRWIFV